MILVGNKRYFGQLLPEKENTADSSTEFWFSVFFFGQACLEAYKQSSPDDSESKIQFQRAFADILGDVQSVIDSPHTRKEKREKIVALCENAQDIMKDILERQKNNKVSLYLYP